MKLTKKDKGIIRAIISERTIVSVNMGRKMIWNCNAVETDISKALKISGNILRMDEQGIVDQILEYLGNRNR